MKRRSLLAGLFALAGFAAVPTVQAVSSDVPCRKPLTVTAVDERSVQVSGEKDDLKRFMRDWQTSLWPTWQTDLNEQGTNGAIKQMSEIDADIEAGKSIAIFNHSREFHQAIGYALAKHFAKSNS